MESWDGAPAIIPPPPYRPASCRLCPCRAQGNAGGGGGSLSPFPSPFPSSFPSQSPFGAGGERWDRGCPAAPVASSSRPAFSTKSLFNNNNNYYYYESFFPLPCTLGLSRPGGVEEPLPRGKFAGGCGARGRWVREVGCGKLGGGGWEIGGPGGSGEVKSTVGVGWGLARSRVVLGGFKFASLDVRRLWQNASSFLH